MTQYVNLNSLLLQCNENDDVLPRQLSGDQDAQRSVHVSLSFFPDKKANLFLTVTTIIKAIVGAGILALPYTFSRVGYGLILIIFTLVVLIFQFQSTVLLKIKNLSRHSNYSTIAYHIFRNNFMKNLPSMIILLVNFGFCILIVTILKSSIKKIIDSYHPQYSQEFYTSTTFLTLMFAIILFPLVLIKKIERLGFFSFLGVFGIFTFIIGLAIIFINDMSQNNWKCDEEFKAFQTDIMEIAVVLPNIILSFGFTFSYFPIYKGIKDSNDQKMKKATLLSFITCGLIFLLIGNMGYCLFGRRLQGNFLLAFDRNKLNDSLYLLLNLGYLLSVFFSYTLIFFGCRNNFISIVNTIVFYVKKKRYDEKKKRYDQNKKDLIKEIGESLDIDDRQDRKNKALKLFYLYTTIIFICNIVIGILVDSIEDVLNVLGAIGTSTLDLILPAFFYLTLVRKKKKLKNISYYIAWTIFLFFIPFGIFSIASNYISK